MDKSREVTRSKRNRPISRFSDEVGGETEAEIAPLKCLLSDLTVLSTHSSKFSGTIVNQEDAIAFAITVEFGQSGAIAFMPLNLRIRVDFYAKPVGRGEALDLGCAIVHTTANQFIYTPILQINSGLKTIGLIANQAYQITALLRIGAPDYPAFVTGVLEGLMIQVYSAPPGLPTK
jgi:hypothetical protein